jgi:hypothetical protein
MTFTTIICDSPIKCPKKVLENHARNPLIFQAEQRVTILAEKAYFSGRTSL